MTQPQTFNEIYQKVTKQISSSVDEWKSFLDFSSQVHKYSFPEKLMIYDQNPNVEYLADFQTWNELGRMIKRNESSIILFEDLSDRFSIRQLFDYRQTYGEEIIFPNWALSIDDARKAVEVFYQKIFSESLPDNRWDVGFYDLIDHGVQYYADKDTSYFIRQDQTKLFISESVNFVIGKKINSFRTISDDFVLEQIRDYKPGFELNNVGVVISEVSQKMLQHIYSIHQELQKEEEKNHEHTFITDVEPERIRSTASGLWNDREGISEGELSVSVHQSHDGGGLDEVPTQSPRMCDQSGDEPRATSAESESIPEHREFVTVGESLESDSISSDGTSDFGDSESDRQSINEPEKEADSQILLPFFEPESIVEIEETSDPEDEIIPAEIPQSLADELVTNNYQGDKIELNEPVDLFDFDFFDDTVSYEISTKKQESKNYYLDTTNQYSSGKREKFRDNIRAIRTLHQLESGKLDLSRENQDILVRYSGWGGLQEAFDERDSSWQKEYQELKGLLPEKEYEKARSSVLTAFYTSTEIVQEMYTALNQIGDFSKKKLLDPGMGTGNFFMNLPENLRSTEQIGIEIDPLTSRIAKQLLPDATIHQTGYENVEITQKVDAVITNVPFNNIRIRDKKYDQHRFPIHEYFLAKSIDVLKENGVMMVITSAALMDKKTDRAREYLAKRANLIGAIRLPKTAFRQSAGTEVISDILLFQKKSYSEMTQAYEPPTWTESIPNPDFPEIHMNRYFIENPSHILGEIAIKNFHGQTMDILPKNETPFRQQLHNAFQSFIEDKEFLQTSKPVNNRLSRSIPSIEPLKPKDIDVPSDARKFTFLEIDSTIIYHHIDGKYDLIPQGRRQQKIRMMLTVKEVLNDVIALQQGIYTPEQLNAQLEKLNTSYDRFTARYGFFNTKENIRDLRMDDQYPLLRSIEKEQSNTFVKQPIFFKATIQPPTVISEVDTSSKALELSLAKTARVDFRFIQSIYPNHSIEEIIGDLEGQIFLNPQKLQSLGFENSWEYCDEYLTGNVKEKLTVATLASARESDPELKTQYEKNIVALEAAQPAPLQAGDIDFKLGSPWIPLEYYNQFCINCWKCPVISEELVLGKSLLIT